MYNSIKLYIYYLYIIYIHVQGGFPKLKKRSDQVFVQLFRSPASLLASILYFCGNFRRQKFIGMKFMSSRVGLGCGGLRVSMLPKKGRGITPPASKTEKKIPQLRGVLMRWFLVFLTTFFWMLSNVDQMSRHEGSRIRCRDSCCCEHMS